MTAWPRAAICAQGGHQSCPLHGARKSGIGLAPGRLYVRRECGAETLLQRPQEGSSDWRVVLWRYTVAAMPAAEIAHRWKNDIQLVKIVDGRRQHPDQLDLLSGKIGREQRSHFRRNLEEPTVEKIGGFRCDRGNRFEAALHECDLLGRHEGSSGGLLRAATVVARKVRVFASKQVLSFYRD